MKRFLTILVTTLLLTAVLCVTASASDFDAAAEDLSKIGMFRGTANGFELDRAPTRSEAAIMLVRLYGAEDVAKADYAAGKIKHPFTDVSDFAAPYAAWLYTNGIANGTSATTFGSARACTIQNYAAFLLRALGYKDGTDFQYADVLTFAQSKGFYEPVMFSGAFLRDDLAALTYQALAADMADGKTYLLDSLIQSGVIDAKAVSGIKAKIDAYRGMEAAMGDAETSSMDADIDMKMNMSMSAAGETAETAATTTAGNVKVIAADPADLQMASTLKTAMDGESMDTSMWIKDGWMYLSTTAAGKTTQLKYAIDDETDALAGLGIVDMDAMNVSGLAMLNDITTEKSGSDTVYTMVLGKGTNGLLGGLSGLTGESLDLDMELGDITAVYTVSSSGKLKTVDMVFSADMKLELPMEDGTSANMSIHYDYDMAMKINAIGKDVKINYPDFSKFQELDPDTLNTTVPNPAEVTAE